MGIGMGMGMCIDMCMVMWIQLRHVCGRAVLQLAGKYAHVYISTCMSVHMDNRMNIRMST